LDPKSLTKTLSEETCPAPPGARQISSSPGAEGQDEGERLFAPLSALAKGERRRNLIRQKKSVVRPEPGASAVFSPAARALGVRYGRMAIIGKRNTLSIVRASQPGLYLDGGELGEILLPGRYIPADIAPKQKLDVFIYRDSEDRLVATTETPNAMVGEFACMEVINVRENIGAFLNWGLAKDLLIPFREQEYPLRVGDKVVVYVGLDAQTNRLIASTRLSRHLSHDTPAYQDGQPVSFLIFRETDLGYSAIVENAHLGLLYKNNIPAPLRIGQKLKGFVRTVRPNGKIDLSLDAAGYKRVASLTDLIVTALKMSGGKLPFDDDSSPVLIRQNFSVSKKAFKQALGKLYKLRRIAFTNPGIELLDNSNWIPGANTKS
jgi:predicted RNA-binding protein (virulence factor B family)